MIEPTTNANAPTDSVGVCASGATRVLRPLLDVGPVPGGSSADGPARVRETQLAVSPLVEGGAADAEAVAHLDDADGVTGHARSVSKVLTLRPECEQNTYMTKTQMAPAKVDELLAAKGLDSWLRTIQKGIKAARRDGRTYFIGATALAYFIETEAHVGTKFEARPTGEVFKVEA